VLPSFYQSTAPFSPVDTADAVLSSNLDVPLKGIAIGNGWIDPKKQYPSYLDYSVKMGILQENSAVRCALLLAVTAHCNMGSIFHPY